MRAPVQQSSSFAPCSLFQVCHCAKTVRTVEEAERTGLSGSPWPVSSREGPWAPALLQNKSQILGEDNACSQQWHLAAEGSCHVCQGDLHGQWAALPKPAPVVANPVSLLVYGK